MKCSSKKCATDCSILIFIFILLIHIYIVQYLTKLHNNHNNHNNHNRNSCECLDSNNIITPNTILFIKYYSIITIILIVIILFNKLFCSILNISLTRYSSLKPFYLIYSITGLVSIYLLYRLTSTLRLKKCKCDSEKEHDKEIEILYYYSIIVVSIYVCVIFMSTFISIFYKDLKTLKYI